MGTLHNHPFFIRYQGGAGDHVVQISAGRTIRSGVGQSFWLRKGRCALAEVPTANRAHSFLVQVASSDQQNVNAQVAVTYCIENAEAAAAHYDFGLYPREAKKDAQGLWQIDETVTRIAHSALASTIGAMALSEAISGSLERVSGLLTQAFAANEQLQATGVGIVDVRLLSLRPDEGVESSLRAPLLEQLRAEADRALYHAALAHAANHLVTIMGQSQQALASIGVEDPSHYLGPLVRAALDNALAAGETALTGPVIRGDSGTVTEHLRALREYAEQENTRDIADSYAELVKSTAKRAHNRGLLNDEQLGRVESTLTEHTSFMDTTDPAPQTRSSRHD